MSVPVHLLKGNDDVLRGEALSKLLDLLVGSDDRSLLVDEFDLDTVKLGAAIDAAQTSPFLTERRIVVVRRFGQFSKAEDVKGLVAYLDDPLNSSIVVLVWEKSVSPVESGEPAAQTPRIPPTLTKAITAAGGKILDADQQGKNIAGWVGDELSAAGLDLDAPARSRVVKTMGEDAGSLIGLIETLRGAYGTGSRLTAEDVEPYLGPAGGVPPWDLTDAIDSGDVPKALDQLERMMHGGDRHPLAIMASLQSHYTRMARLDGAGARGEKEAAQLLGLKGSTFPAKKALNQSKRLGGPGVRRAVQLLAAADVDLRGARAWPGELVMEVLVARLTTLAR
ncbi:MAG: DNA polymerase III subunit delta [Acidimicrobiia bacterium]|nr:DNA polymerase III subunit delta [Acidimicrobiia bacterium]